MRDNELTEIYYRALDGKPLDGFDIPPLLAPPFEASSLPDLRETHLGLIGFLREAIAAAANDYSSLARRGLNDVFRLLEESEMKQHALLCADQKLRLELESKKPHLVSSTGQPN